ncbi:MAG: Calx-beta domain-containing protein, partial [Thermoanaerobaculia bacterium]
MWVLVAVLVGALAGPSLSIAQLICNDPPEAFSSGIPASWSVVQAQGPAWTGRGACQEKGNFTGAGGNAACVSSDLAGPAPFATELRSPIFDLSGTAAVSLRFDANYQSFAATDSLEIDLSSDGGATWVTLRRWGEDHGAFRSLPGETAEIDLSAYAGLANLMLRWRYFDADAEAFGWYAQIDDVRLICDSLPICSSPPISGIVADGGFEAGTGSGAWAESSTAFGSPLCTTSTCGLEGARSGDGWAFLGGVTGAAEVSSLEQSIVIEPGIATLAFYLWIPEASGNSSDVLRVLIDDQPLLEVAEHHSSYRSGYRRVEVNLSAFADGGSHALRFEAITSGSSSGTNFYLDDVAFEVCGGVSSQPEITVADVDVIEGNTGFSAAVFTIRLLSPTTEVVTVDFATADETATAGSDYEAVSGSATFAVGETEREISVPVFGEFDIEDNESFVLNLSNPLNATLLRARATGLIRDDDTPAQISIGDVVVHESDLGTVDALFEAVLSEPSEEIITVDFVTAEGTATAGADYIAQSGILTFSPGTTTTSVTIRVVGDDEPEPPETFFVVLTNPINSVVADAEGQATITNDDDPPAISISDTSVVEGDAGTVEAVFDLTLSFASHETITVGFATQDETALAGEDYAAAAAAVSFDPGQTVATLAVIIRPDGEQEDDEIFSVSLVDPLNATIESGTASATIVDDDLPDGLCLGGELLANGSFELQEQSGDPSNWLTVAGSWIRVTPPLEAVDGVYAAGAGPAPVAELAQDINVSAYAGAIAGGEQSFRLEGYVLSADTSPADGTRVVVEYRDQDDLTVLDAFDSGEITSVSGWHLISDIRPAPAETGWIRVRLISTRYEGSGNETFYDAFSLRATKLPALETSDVTVVEGAAGPVDAVFDLTLSCGSHEEITVDVTTTDGSATAGADYLSQAVAATFAAGERLQSVAVPVLDDTITERDETFALELANASGAVTETPSVTGTILDALVPTVLISDASVLEGDVGSVLAAFAVTLSAPFTFDVLINYASADGTAYAGSDYQPVAGKLTVDAGEAVGEILVPVLGDEVSEGPEDFFLHLSSPVNALLGNATAHGLIENDDAVPMLSIENGSAPEGDKGEGVVRVPVRLSTHTDRVVTVDFQTSPVDTAYKGLDFEPVSGTVNIPIGETLTYVDVPVYGDTLPEGDERVRVTLGNPVNAALAEREAYAVILEDDAECVGPNLLRNGGNEESFISGRPPGWEEVSGNWEQRGGNNPLPLEGQYSFRPDPYGGGVPEWELRQDIDVTGFSEAIDASQQEFFFEGYFRTFEGGNARIDLEYLDGAGDVLTSRAIGPILSAYEYHPVIHLQLAPLGTEVVRVRLRGGTSGFYDALSLRPLGAPALIVEDVTVGEGDAENPAAGLPISLTCAAEGDVSVDYSTADGSATVGNDYLAAGGLVTIPAGQLAATVEISILDDTVEEPTESFLVHFAAASGASLARGQGVVTIVDDDGLPSISIADGKASEGDEGTRGIFFTVSLSHPAKSEVKVDFATADGSALADEDYLSESGTVVFDTGSQSRDIVLQVVGDSDPEANETFRVDLSNPLGGSLTDSSSVGIILDDDAAISVSINNVTLEEEGDRGTRDAVLTVTLSKPVYSSDVGIEFATVDSSATAASDYLPLSGTLTIPRGLRQGQIRVSIVGDQVYEPAWNDTEGFSVALMRVSPSEVAIADGSGWVSIKDDDLFINRFKTAARGGMTFTGNTLGLSRGSDTEPGTQGRIGVFTTTDTTLQHGDYPPGTTTDWTLNSSAAVLDLPSGSQVLYAELIWGGLGAGVEAYADGPVTLVTPEGAHSVWPDPEADRGSAQGLYSRFTEVTELVAAGGGGTYEVRGVPARLLNYNSGLLHAGWTLAVIYGAPDLPLRNLSLMTGGRYCSYNGHSQNNLVEPVDYLVPASWPFTGHMHLSAAEGDANGADHLWLYSQSPSNASWNWGYRLSGPNNVVDNFFASQINDDNGLLDTRGTFGDLNHQPWSMTIGGRQGWDITNVPISHILFAGATGGYIQERCDNSLFLHALGFEVETAAAVFPSEVKTVDRTFARVGEALTYAVELRNEGTVVAEEILFHDALPTGLELVSDSLGVNGVPVPSADPQIGVPLGTIEPGASLLVTFQAEIEDLPSEELPSEYSNRASWTYKYREAPDQPLAVAEVTTNEVVTYNEDSAFLTIEDVSITEGDSGQPDAVFTVTLSSPIGAPVVVDFATVEGTALQGTDYLAGSGSRVFLPGELEKTIAISVVDDGLAELTETFSVVLTSESGVRFARDTATVTITDDDGSAVSISDVQVIEGNSGSVLAVFTVISSNVTGQVVTVDYVTEDGSATAGSDYISQASTLVFEPGQAAASIAIEVLGDLLDEGNELFAVRLVRASNSDIDDDIGVASIVDDDGPVPVSVSDATVFEGNEGTSLAAFTVSIPFPVVHDVTVDFATADDSALAGVDYLPAAGTVTVPVGETSVAFSVEIIGNTDQNPSRSFFVDLSNPAPLNVTLGDARGVGTILDDEPLPRLSISDAEVSEGDAGTVQAVFEMELSDANIDAVSVGFEAFNGTAQAGSDFVGRTGTLTLQPGEISATITVDVNGDTVDETDESFFVLLSSPANAFVSRSTGEAHIVDDDDDGTCLGSNLLANPGCEMRLVDGEIPAWTEVSGQWVPRSRDSFNPKPIEAFAYFEGDRVNIPELAQDVDVSMFADAIDGAGLQFAFSGYSHPSFSAPTYSRIVIEYRDETNNVVLVSYDSGQLLGGDWIPSQDTRLAPVGTRTIRVRLICGGNAHASKCQFDGLALRIVGTPTLAIDDVSVPEGNGGSTAATFEAALSCEMAETVSADFATRDGSAITAEDYVATTDTLEFAPGEVKKTIDVIVLGDTEEEPDEVFFIELRQPAGAPIARPEGRGLITNDDAPAMDLALCLDGSGSLSPTDWQLQLEGLAQAVEDPTVVPHNNTVRVSVFQFTSGAGVEIAPVVINSDNAEEVAALIRTRSQAGGNTDLEACIDLATAVIGQQLPVSSKQVI